MGGGGGCMNPIEVLGSLWISKINEGKKCPKMTK